MRRPSRAALGGLVEKHVLNERKWRRFMVELGPEKRYDGVMPTHAIFVLGDQLSARCGAFDGLAQADSVVCMSERASEGFRPVSHQARIAYFIACMRRFAARVEGQGWRVSYRKLGDEGEPELWRDLARLAKESGASKARCAWPGEHALVDSIEKACAEFGLDLEWVEDGKFIYSRSEFGQWAASRKSMLQEAFYRHARANTGILMDPEGAPVGGKWNFDSANRSGYPKGGPGLVPPRPMFELVQADQDAIAEVGAMFSSNPGSLAQFNWPLDEDQARQAAIAFLDDKLAGFGVHQDAMWDSEPFGNHALLSAPLNVGLLDPLWLCQQVQFRFDSGLCPIESAEGFIRQVLGWREYIRGMYWLRMPALATKNEMGASLDLPAWFWDPTKTKMSCMRSAIGQTMEHGQAHHIQRLMVIGNFCLSAGIEPKQVADWFGGIYVDAVEWVHLPNVMGMALHADGGDLATKPYLAGGSYISKQSNYCKSCSYDPKLKTGPKACPLSVMYWGAVDRHQIRMAANPRSSMPVAQWRGLSDEQRLAIRESDQRMRSDLDAL
jgi:deoxyribodipyrimidine photolyase-related protein